MKTRLENEAAHEGKIQCPFGIGPDQFENGRFESMQHQSGVDAVVLHLFGEIRSARQHEIEIAQDAVVISRTRAPADHLRSEEHTSELQSLAYLVCRLLLEKKKVTDTIP